MKRKHQIEFETAIDSIIAGSQATRLIVNVTPGGGKSALPIVSGKLIQSKLVDKLLWICPRQALQVQGETNFIDPFFRSMFCHNLTIRSSTNENDPARGNDGFITTYQAAAVDEHRSILQDLRKWRYAVILDEFHHVEKGGEWHVALEKIMKAAKYHILMTGTLQRGDDKKIAFIDYLPNGFGHIPVLESNGTQKVISYTRSDALAERAILPIHFVFCDGKTAWENQAGDQVNADSFYNVLPKERGHALYAALSTEFAEQLLSLALNHFLEYRKTSPTSRLLVVTANIGEARRHFKLLAKMGYNVAIATSHESKEAQEKIAAFKAGEVNILITIAMAYEGLDVPEVSHIACLTHIRSKPWIEQMFARAVRINRPAGAWSDQLAYVFVPDDVVMREIVYEINAEQIAHAKDSEARSLILKPGAGTKIPPIMPLSSDMGAQREATLAEKMPLTPKQEEEAILRQIEGHIRRYAFANRMEARTINTELVREFGKGRRQMRLAELNKLYVFVQKHYGLGTIRGTGRKRVPTKARFVQASLFDTGFLNGFVDN